jgi:hypothetical protein
MIVRWLAFAVVVSLGAAACHGDDIPAPDVFIDYDARGMLPDGAVEDLVVSDAAIDATNDAVDASDTSPGG